MGICTCYYYCAKSGRCDVEEFVDDLSESSCRHFFYKVELLEEFGPKLPMPHAKKIDKKEKIYELRFNERGGVVRALYFFFEGDEVVFTNAFVKKTNKTPKKEIETAINRKKLFLSNKAKKRVKK